MEFKSGYWIGFFISLILTAAFYLGIPVAIVFSKLNQDKLVNVKKTVIISCVSVFAFFFLFHLLTDQQAPNAVAPFLWGTIGYVICEKRRKTIEREKIYNETDRDAQSSFIDNYATEKQKISECISNETAKSETEVIKTDKETFKASFESLPNAYSNTPNKKTGASNYCNVKTNKSVLTYIAFSLVFLISMYACYKISYSKGMDNGYTLGYQKGHEDEHEASEIKCNFSRTEGYNTGKKDGYDTGWDDGWDAGWDDGWNSYPVFDEKVYEFFNNDYANWKKTGSHLFDYNNVLTKENYRIWYFIKTKKWID